MPTDSVKGLMIWRLRAVTIMSKAAAAAATRVTKLVVVSIFILVTVYLAYGRVWQPLQAIVPLPPGVVQSNPEVNLFLLQTINEQRVQRMEQPRLQPGAQSLFRPGM